MSAISFTEWSAVVRQIAEVYVLSRFVANLVAIAAVYAVVGDTTTTINFCQLTLDDASTACHVAVIHFAKTTPLLFSSLVYTPPED
jgi:hypothetical protein